MPNVRLPFPHLGQRTVRQEAKRFNWLSAGRRWRKTTLAMSIMVESAIKGGVYVWGAPTFDQVRIGFNETRRACSRYANFNMSRMTVTFPGGGEIIYKSLDNPDNARGLTANGIVIDECADVKEQAWYEVLRPMLIDTDGWAWGIGTPKGRNWFWKEHQSAYDRDDTMCWQAPTLGVRVENGKLVRDYHPLENPSIPFDEIDILYHTLSERTFQQEILAQFIESGGGVFRRIMDAATATELKEGEPLKRYIYGCDWARHNDFTVFTVIDPQTHRMVAMDRFNQIDYSLQVLRLRALCKRFPPAVIIAEENSMGGPIVERLQKEERLPVRAFVTTNATKADIIEGLSLAFEQSSIEILNDPILIGELMAFDQERTPSGMIRYGAPQGMTDDCVMSLALAWHGCRETVSAVIAPNAVQYYNSRENADKLINGRNGHRPQERNGSRR